MAACPLPSTARPPRGLCSVIKAALSSESKCIIVEENWAETCPEKKGALKAVFSSSVTLRLDRAAVAEETAFLNIYRKHTERMKERRVQINNYHQFVNSEVLHCVEIQH